MMKVLLIQPPIEDFYDTDIRLLPLGLTYLKASVNKFLPEIEIVLRDYHHGHGKKNIPLPVELHDLKKYYDPSDKSPFCTFGHYFRFGASNKKIIEDIEEINPDLIAISALFTPYFSVVRELALAIKHEFKIPILLGGGHPSACPNEVISHPEIDYIIRGEGERPFVQFLEYLQGMRPIENVSSLGYKKYASASSNSFQIILNKIEENFHIDEIPSPASNDNQLTPWPYKFYKKKIAFVLSSRGCPHHCSFCSVHSIFGKKYRQRTVESIVHEIEHYYQAGVRIIDFEDDNLTFNRRRMMNLCKSIGEKFKDSELEFLAMNGISYISLDDELLANMHSVGFSHLNISLVSTAQASAQASSRQIDLEKFQKTVLAAWKLGYKITSYQILGLPGESIQTMINTLIFLCELPILIGLSPFYLIPGTSIADFFPPQNERDFFRARLTCMGNDNVNTTITKDDIYTLFVIGRMINFLKGLPIISNDCHIDNLLAINEDNSLLNKREALGIALLRRLILENHFANKSFNHDIFSNFLAGLKFITTQSGWRVMF
ncbi:MAG TPA: radical SAM protein [Bacteriovoracaceae bacterium]|nr:radical SAM protein [Bacteriovoracaceae bacterium]